MKKGISYLAFPGGPEGAKSIGACFSEARETRFEAVELLCGEAGKLSLKSSQRQCEQIRRRAERSEIEIAALASAIYWDYHVASNRVTDRSRAEQATRKMLQIAQWLGTGTLQFIPGAVDVFFNADAEVISYDIVLTRAKQGIKRLLKYAERCEVTLAIENVWNRFLLSPIEMRDFIDGFKSEFVGAYFDTGNVLAYGYPEQWIRILGKRIKCVRFKNFKRAVGTEAGFCGLLEGDVNWRAVMKALRTIGYNGYCIADPASSESQLPNASLANASSAMDVIMAL